MMEELSAKLGFLHENSTPYYPQANGQVEAINKVLKTMLRRMVGLEAVLPIRDASLANESHKKHVKAQYDKSIQSCAFNEGDLVLNYD